MTHWQTPIPTVLLCLKNGWLQRQGHMERRTCTITGKMAKAIVYTTQDIFTSVP